MLESQLFFESLPAGMFNNIEGIQASGKVSFSLHFDVDTKIPDSLHFMSSLKKENFRLLRSGKADLMKMKNTFEYLARDWNDNVVKSIIVGPESPDFVPLEQIPSFLKIAVLTSEDGSFFHHRGFNEEAFRQSIAVNISRDRFARGGSTISMQLVKNIYLSRKKYVARKMEEMLMVWLIENNYLCSKERMYEVYLNIIEWGPGIYGVKEAAEFYFNKKPVELSLAESIFLASIIPNPKAFRYSFDKEGELKPSLKGYYSLVSKILLKKELITEEDYTQLLPAVELKGNARELIIQADTILPDSALFENNNITD